MALLALTSVVLAVLWLRSPVLSPNVPFRKLALPTREPPFNAVISPNGRHIAYVTSSGVLKVQDLDRDEAREIAGPGIQVGFVKPPSWSPDSKFIAFPFENELRKVAVLGGHETKVCDVPGQYRLSSWSLDGSSILFGARYALYEVSAQGGQPQVLVEPWDEQLPYVSRPQELPSHGNRKLLYQAFSSGTNDARFVVQDLTTGHRVILGKGFGVRYSPSGHIIYQRFDPPGIMALPFSAETLSATGEPFQIGVGESPFSFSRDGTFVYTGLTAGVHRLLMVDRGGNPLRTIGAPRVNFETPTFSPDGGRVAFSEWVEAGNPDVWVYEVDGPGQTRVTVHEGRDLSPVWSSDGKRLVFTSSRQGDRNLFVKRADGGGEATALVTTPALREYASDWSQDGKLLFQRLTGSETGSDLWYLKRKGAGNGHEEIPFLENSADEWTPQLSPDGKRVAYVSDQSGQYEVWICSFPSGDEQRRVSLNGGVQPRWRGDGKELFYVQGQTLMARPISTSPSLTIGVPKALFVIEELNPVRTKFSYDVLPDGEHFVLAEQIEEESTTVRVVQNWYEEFSDRKQD